MKREPDASSQASLPGRLMRHLGAMGYIKETGLDEYRPTNFSTSMSLPMIGDGYIAM